MAIELLSNPYKWAGVPFEKRYSETTPPATLLARMQEIDPLLDLKFYMPTERWHVVRWFAGRGFGKPFVRVWECRDDPARGLRDYLGDWIIDALKAGDTRGRDILKEVDEANAKIEKKAAEDMELHAKDTAKDLCKVLTNWHDYGANSDTHLNYAVGADIKSEKKDGFTVNDKRKVA
jgi:hypothetical protein